MRMLRQRPAEWGHGIHAWVRGHRRVSGGVGGVLLFLLVAAALAPAPGWGQARSSAFGAPAEPAPVALPTTPTPPPAPSVPPAPSAVPRPPAAPVRVAAVPPPAPPSPVATTPTAEQATPSAPTPSATADQARSSPPATGSSRSCGGVRATGAVLPRRGQPGLWSVPGGPGAGTGCEPARSSTPCPSDAADAADGTGAWGAGAWGGLPRLGILPCLFLGR
ncbi:hypothetical protein [Parafrankia discariae]|uniref:hypothetical protein n=1 Tax=Parafrankia discariae TaxID=365528 RepID=UPI0012B69005|nr:hypothetical protein [Parafrankia discariae]